MKYIKLFNTDSEYQEFASSAAQPIPNVSYVTETDEVHYNESDPILFAYEYQSDKFVMGVVIGSDIYVDTYETGFIVADGSGKFSTALAYTNDDLINIQNAIKDHYHLAASTIKTKAPLIEYAVGDTVTNWNAYKKIELEHIAIKMPNQYGNNYLFGGIKGSTYEVQAKDNYVIYTSREGEILSTRGEPLDNELIDFVKQKMAGDGFPITSVVPIQSTLGVGDSVNNWYSYIKIDR